jgi:hypothetical protein
MRHAARYAGLAAAAAAVPVLLRARTRASHWGATPDEVAAALPGDPLVRDPGLVTTRAITIAAPPEAVFPWLDQLGQGRGGFYSYDWLENRTGLDIHSADRILAEHQHLHTGDRVPVAPGPDFYGFTVAEVAAPDRLVLRMRVHPFTGRPTGLQAAGSRWLLDASWAFALRPIEPASTRLLTRTRVALRLPAGLAHLYRLVLEVLELVMERRMLLGIRERAERTSGPSASPGPAG